MADELVTPDPNQPSMAEIQRHMALAQALMGETGGGTPVGSPWQAVNRAVSPLLGALLEKRTAEQYGNLSASAAPELAQIAQSENPIALAAQSQNPLIRAMLPDWAQAQIQGTLGARNKGLETYAVGNARLGYEPQLTAANEQAKVAPAVQTAVESEKGRFPYLKALTTIQAARPVALQPGAQLVNPMSGAVVGNNGGSGPANMPF